MSVVLYGPGSTHTVKGIKCQMQVCNEFSFMHMLDAGWFLSPEEVYQEVAEEETPVIQQEEEVVNTDKFSHFSDEMIRSAAKEACIRGWHNTGIKKLRKKLDDTQI